jgi:hypothetical protein
MEEFYYRIMVTRIVKQNGLVLHHMSNMEAKRLTEEQSKVEMDLMVKSNTDGEYKSSTVSKTSWGYLLVFNRDDMSYETELSLIKWKKF